MGNEQAKCVERPTLDDMGSAETAPLEIEARRLSLSKKQKQHPRTPQPQSQHSNNSYFIETRPNLRPTHAQVLHNASKKASARRLSHNYIYNGGATLITNTNTNTNTNTQTLDYLEPDISSPSLSPETNMDAYGSNSATYSISGDTEYGGDNTHEPQRKVSSPSSKPKLSIHKRSQSDHSPTNPPTLSHRKSAQSMRSTEREKERRRKSKKRKRRKSKALKKMRSHQDQIHRDSEREAKYISQQVQTEYLKKQNEELKRQNLRLRQKFISIEDDEDEKEKLPEIPDRSNPIQYPTQHRVSWKQSASPKSRHSEAQLKFDANNRQISPHRSMLRGSTHDQRDNGYNSNNIYQPKKAIVAVAPRPKLQPIFSKDDGQQFDEHIKLRDKASGRGRYYSDGSILIPDKVMTDGIKMGIPMDSMVNGHSENIWNLSFDGKCEGVEKCVAIQRIIFALKWYSNAHGDADVVWKKIRDKRYGAHLITDYHHVMHYHLNRGDPKAIQQEKMQICGMIYKFISKCDANLCLGYKRKQIESLEFNNNNKQSQSVRVQHGHRYSGGHVPFYVNCMDTLHCYFMHFPSIQFNNNHN